MITGSQELLVEGVAHGEHLLLVLPQLQGVQRRGALDDPQRQQLSICRHALAVEARDALVKAVRLLSELYDLAVLVFHALVGGFDLLERGQALVKARRAELLEDLEGFCRALLVEAQGGVVAPVARDLLVDRQGDALRELAVDLAREHVDVEEPAVNVLHLGGVEVAVLVDLVAKNQNRCAHRVSLSNRTCISTDGQCSAKAEHCAHCIPSILAHLHRAHTALVAQALLQ